MKVLLFAVGVLFAIICNSTAGAEKVSDSVSPEEKRACIAVLGPIGESRLDVLCSVSVCQ